MKNNRWEPASPFSQKMAECSPFTSTETMRDEALQRRSDFLNERITMIAEHRTSCRVLSLSGYDSVMIKILRARPDSNIRFDCIEQQQPVTNRHTKIRTLQMQAFQLLPDIKYDLIWSSGLLDRFEDEAFTAVLRMLFTRLTKNGQLVIGSFTDFLNEHQRTRTEKRRERGPHELLTLASVAGFPLNGISIIKRDDGMNLFLQASS